MFAIKFKSVRYDAILIGTRVYNVTAVTEKFRKKKQRAFECTTTYRRKPVVCGGTSTTYEIGGNRAARQNVSAECKNETASQPDETRPVLFVTDRSCCCSHSADNPRVRHGRTHTQYWPERGVYTVRRLSHTNGSGDSNRFHATRRRSLTRCRVNDNVRSLQR